MKSYIEQRIQVMKNEYMNNPLRIKSDYQKEMEAVAVYKGREILELIQNADDELTNSNLREVKITFTQNVLKISNNGSPFSKDGIDSLMYSNVSAKSKKKDLIGNKGTGFRAILGWAREIKINSENLRVRFSEDYSQQVLSEICRDCNILNEYKAATLVFPQWIDEVDKSLYTTEISIRVKEDTVITDDINKQLVDIDGELLLFLNRTEVLTVNIEKNITEFRKSILDNNMVLIEKYVNQKLVDQQQWYLNRKDGDFEGKHFSIVIAHNPGAMKQRESVVYSYFPTDVEFPFPVLLHANFNLNSDRNHLLKNDNANRYIMQQATKLLVDTAIKLTLDEVSYAPLQILTPQRSLPKELTDYGFRDILYTEIKHSKLFPTVNNQYISFDENPKFYKTALSLYLHGPGFDDLLMNTKDEKISSLIKELNDGSYPIYSYDDMVTKINRWSKSNNFSQETMVAHAFCAMGFLEQNEYSPERHKKMPSLIYDSDEKLLSQGSTVYIVDRKSDISTPPFTQIRFMHSDMKKIFEEMFHSTRRNLAVKLSKFGVKEYSAAAIIDRMNSHIKKRIDEDKHEKAMEYCVLQIKWLWRNRHILENLGEKAKIYLVTRKGGIELSDTLYLGEEYENFVCENLFTGKLKDKFAADIREYINGESAPLDEIIRFMKSLGTEKYPRQKNESLYPDNSYRKKILQSLSYPYAIGDTVFTDLESMCSRITEMKVEVLVIDELEDILRTSETEHIIEWINNDATLAQILFSRKEINNGKVKILWDLKREYRRIPLNKIYAFTYWQFETIPWIKVGNERIKIAECLLSKIGSSLEPELYEPDLEEYIKNIEGSKSRLRREYENVLNKLGVESDFADLSVDKIYSVLNLLPVSKVSEDITKRLYNSLIKSSRTFEGELKGPPYEEYKINGKVLCNTGYKNISESYYLDNRSVCDKFAKTFNLIKIQKRQSSSKISKLLCVEKLKLDVKPKGLPEIHPENSLFQNDFSSYIPMAFCYRIEKASNDEAKRFSELKIVLCTSLRAEYDNKVLDLDEYDYVLKDEKTFYLKIPESIKSLEEMKQDVTFAGAISNVLCSYIDVNESFSLFRELYRASDSARKDLVAQVFDDDSIIKEAKIKLNYSNDIREEFINIISECTQKIESNIYDQINEINFSNINSIENGHILISFFQNLGIDISDFNSKNPTISIDLDDYYQDRILNLMPLYKNQYKIHLYNSYKNKSINEKKRLVTMFMNYEYIKHEPENSVYYDFEKEFLRKLGLIDAYEEINIVDIYNNNRIVWESSLKEVGFVSEFLNIPSNMSLLYFAEYEELNKEYQLLIDSILADEDLEEEEIIEEDPIILYPVTKPLNQKSGKARTKGVNRAGFTLSKTLEKIGFQGEKYVYNTLIKKYANTVWASENGKIAQVNPEGVAGLGYDLEYIDEYGVRRYVEVKSSKGKDIIFYLSENEYNFAIKHTPVFSVYFVSEVGSEKPKILILNDVFKGNDFNSINYALDTSKEYKVMATY